MNDKAGKKQLIGRTFPPELLRDQVGGYLNKNPACLQSLMTGETKALLLTLMNISAVERCSWT